MAGVLSSGALLRKAEAYKAAELDTGSLRLYQNDYTPTPDSLLADFTVANFGGYSNKTIALWGSAFLDALGRAITLAPTQLFTASGVAPANLIYGWYYVGVSGLVELSERFPAPISMELVTDALPLAIQSVDVNE